MFNPLISVAIVAYNRRRFLLSALKSVANQSFRNYEVIVAKNFYDQAIDEFIKRHRFKDIFVDSKYYGEQLAVAIEESRGNMISFLEEDDEFEHDKLYWVKEILTK
jgi:glycosyltransferase involved in cell wall biosynthesis